MRRGVSLIIIIVIIIIIIITFIYFFISLFFDKAKATSCNTIINLSLYIVSQLAPPLCSHFVGDEAAAQ